MGAQIIAARLHVGLGDIQLAQKILTRLAQLRPFDDHIHLWSAQLHGYQHNHAEQIQSLEAALPQATHKLPLLNELWTLYRLVGDSRKERDLEPHFSGWVKDWPSHRRHLIDRLSMQSDIGMLLAEEITLEAAA